MSLQLVWTVGTQRFHQGMPCLQTHCSGLSGMRKHQNSSPSNGRQETCLIYTTDHFNQLCICTIEIHICTIWRYGNLIQPYYIRAICSDRVWGALSMCVVLPYRLSMVTSWCGNDAFFIVMRIHRSLDGSTREGLSLQGFGIIFNVNFISCWANNLRAIDFRRRAAHVTPC